MWSVSYTHLDVYKRQERTRITRLVAGMCDYLESCNCILAGGETAEMPGVVPESQKAIIRPGLAEALIRARKTEEGLSLIHICGPRCLRLRDACRPAECRRRRA